MDGAGRTSVWSGFDRAGRDWPDDERNRFGQRRIFGSTGDKDLELFDHELRKCGQRQVRLGRGAVLLLKWSKPARLYGVVHSGRRLRWFEPLRTVQLATMVAEVLVGDTIRTCME